jgi:hypothetical protein
VGAGEPSFSGRRLWFHEPATDRPGSGGGVANGLIISRPKNMKLWESIQTIVKNTKSKFYGDSAFEVTGPLLFKKAFNADELENTKMFTLGECETPKRNCLFYDNKPALVMYTDYRDEQKKIGNNDKATNYFELWKNKNVYS